MKTSINLLIIASGHFILQDCQQTYQARLELTAHHCGPCHIWTRGIHDGTPQQKCQTFGKQRTFTYEPWVLHYAIDQHRHLPVRSNLVHHSHNPPRDHQDPQCQQGSKYLDGGSVEHSELHLWTGQHILRQSIYLIIHCEGQGALFLHVMQDLWISLNYYHPVQSQRET